MATTSTQPEEARFGYVAYLCRLSTLADTIHDAFAVYAPSNSRQYLAECAAAAGDADSSSELLIPTATQRRAFSCTFVDEPTAQLDVRGEAEIFDRILAATRDCTTILISHRFSTVRHVDRVCVLEHGRVVELGSHDELMALGGRYRTMFELQASRFGEEEEDEDVIPLG